MKNTVLLSGSKVAVTDYTVFGATDYIAQISITSVVGGVGPPGARQPEEIDGPGRRGASQS